MVGVSKTFPPQKQVLKNIYLSFFYGAKIGIIGLNGSGKSTLLKIIAGIEKDYQGEVVFSPGYSVGYLEQDPKLESGKTVKEIVQEGVQDIVDALKEFEEVNQKFGDPEVLENPDKLNALINRQAELQDKIDATDAWNLDSRLERAMDALRCPPEDQVVDTLSGGERRRVALCRLLLQQPDVLLLDEPTNHLDMRSKDVLKEAIRDFDGTVIIVSHDRDFLDGLATKVYEFGGGLVKEHLGGIYDFLQKKQIESLNDLQKSPSLSSSPSAEKTVAGGNAGATVAQPSAAKLSYEEQKELNKRLKKLERRVADCEAEIEQTEAAISILEAKMATPEGASDMALYEQHQKLKAQLDSVMEEWDAVSCELEEARK
mgnify:CR=1 FL=1